MVDSGTFSALRVRRRLEEIAGTIAEARVSGDVYAGLDAVEHALLAVMDEVAEIAQAVAEMRASAAERDGRGLGTWMRRLAPFRPRGTFPCVDRCYPGARQARRSETDNTSQT